MALHRALDGSHPLREARTERLGGRRHQHLDVGAAPLATGSLACPDCDAPVALVDGPRRPADVLGCGFCGHTAALRDFLSLAAPPRPAVVELRVVPRA